MAHLCLRISYLFCLSMNIIYERVRREVFDSIMIDAQEGPRITIFLPDSQNQARKMSVVDRKIFFPSIGFVFKGLMYFAPFHGAMSVIEVTPAHPQQLAVSRMLTWWKLKPRLEIAFAQSASSFLAPPLSMSSGIRFCGAPPVPAPTQASSQSARADSRRVQSSSQQSAQKCLEVRPSLRADGRNVVESRRSAANPSRRGALTALLAAGLLIADDIVAGGSDNAERVAVAREKRLKLDIPEDSYITTGRDARE